MGSYADADPVAIALEWLQADERVLSAFTEAGISGLREAPWPHLRVFQGPAGSIGDLRIRPSELEVSFEVYGHPDGSTGPALLRRLSVVVMEELLRLGDAEYVDGTPYVVHRVVPGVGPDKQDLSNGQQRWVGSVMVTLRPAPGS